MPHQIQFEQNLLGDQLALLGYHLGEKYCPTYSQTPTHCVFWAETAVLSTLNAT